MLGKLRFSQNMEVPPRTYVINREDFFLGRVRGDLGFPFCVFGAGNRLVSSICVCCEHSRVFNDREDVPVQSLYEFRVPVERR